ncbi:sensor histidine kinase [Mucilaginibacter auburnensis]|uniref:sensor histidine kinase n=1 Tax=Mucilaginibacter auburnensis TaxID=1457233 RepID=UPI000C2434D7|nr:HAMP domain-containing sensor histidine kinase [Mucilaginibacter auburnensis]
MNAYQNRRLWNYILLFFATIIASGSLMYTRYLVKNIARSERSRAQIWALSMKETITADNNSTLSYVFTVRDSSTVPAIVTNEHGEILFSKGLDTTKTFIDLPKDEVIDKKAAKYDPEYFKAQLETMKAQHDPFRIDLPGRAGTLNGYWLIYYKDSDLLTQLRLFPYVQLSVIAIFLLLAYTAFNTSRKSEQNQVWVGLAKETAHQLGTPISSLMAWLELLKDKFNAEEDPLMNEMGNDIKRLEIVADRFSKIGSVPKLEPLVVFDVVKDFVDYFKIRVSHNISFEMSGDNTLKAGLNVPLFDWVIENLLKNAVNAIDGKGSIRVEVIASKTRDLVYIDIIDSGKGIPRSKFNTVFQPGYTTRKRGWGLGLSLTKRIVENYHNGHIVVRDSELGKGTTFRISLKTIKTYETTEA